MKLEDFKVGMKVDNQIGVKTVLYVGEGVVLLKPDYGNIFLPTSYDLKKYTPYVEKKRVKLYHRLWKYDNNPRVQISSSTAFFGPFADRNVITLKEWEEEIEYEVKD